MSLHNSLMERVEQIIDSRLAPLIAKLQKIEDFLLKIEQMDQLPPDDPSILPVKRGPGRPRKNAAPIAGTAEGSGAVPE